MFGLKKNRQFMQSFRCFLSNKLFINSRFTRMGLASGIKFSGDAIFTNEQQKAEFVKRARLFDYWQRCSDDIIENAFRRSKLILMLDNRLAMQTNSIEQKTLELRMFGYQELREIILPYGLEIGTLNSCLLDIWGSATDSNEDYIPLFGTSIRLSQPPKESGMPENKYRDELASLLGVRLLDLRFAMLTMDNPREREWVAKFQSTLRWFWLYQHCPTCTNPLKHRASKSSAHCAFCEREYYPTISPVVISLIRDESDEYALLVRHNRSPSQVFTCIAGFAMAGETLEETVRREVAEEVGIFCWDIKEQGGSQSWPIPACSLMIPFTAVASRKDQLEANIAELECANWFSRREIGEALKRTESDPLLRGLGRKEQNIKNALQYIPPRGAIAHRLIKNWALDGNSKL